MGRGAQLGRCWRAVRCGGGLVRLARLRAVAGQCGGKEGREEALLGCQWVALEGEKRKKRLDLCWVE